MIGFAGLLLTSATGANAQCTPRARPSRAVTSPVKRASSSDRVAPTAIALGSGTTPRRMRKFMPRSMSAAMSSGTSEACCSALIWVGSDPTSDSNTTTQPTLSRRT